MKPKAKKEANPPIVRHVFVVDVNFGNESLIAGSPSVNRKLNYSSLKRRQL